MSQMPQKSFKMPQAFIDRIAALSARSKVPQNELVRRAVEMMLEKAEPAADGDVWQTIAPRQQTLPAVSP